MDGGNIRVTLITIFINLSGDGGDDGGFADSLRFLFSIRILFKSYTRRRRLRGWSFRPQCLGAAPCCVFVHKHHHRSLRVGLGAQGHLRRERERWSVSAQERCTDPGQEMSRAPLVSPEERSSSINHQDSSGRRGKPPSLNSTFLSFHLLRSDSFSLFTSPRFIFIF